MSIQLKSKKLILVIIIFCIFGILLSISFSFNFLNAYEKQQDQKSQPIPVVLSTVQNKTFEERLTVQGNVKSKNYVSVPAMVTATIKKLYVDEGDQVIAGQTPLFESDPTKFQKLVEIRKQELSLARCTRLEQAANLERVKAEFEKANADVKRFRELHKRGAISQDALEQQEARFKQASAMLKHAEVLLQSGTELEIQAKAALAIAEKDLKDCTVYAPINGKVTRIIVEEGEMGEIGKPVLRIEDPSLVEISVLLPANHYERVITNQTKMRIKVYGTELGEYSIVYKSPAIDPRLRTFEVKVLLENPPPVCVPGAIADCTVVLDEFEQLGIPTLALQIRENKQIIFTVEQNKAHQISVVPGIETDGWTEIKKAEIYEGMPVVIMGQFLLNEGSPVIIQEERQ